MAVLAGDDTWALPVLALGGDGVVSVASNEIPAEMASLCAAARAGDWAEARRIHERWLPLFLANFRSGPNPVPVKAALARMGLIDGDAVRSPLLPLDDAARTELAATLRTLGLVDGGGRAAGRRPQPGVRRMTAGGILTDTVPHGARGRPRPGRVAGRRGGGRLADRPCHQAAILELLR